MYVCMCIYIYIYIYTYIYICYILRLPLSVPRRSAPSPT